MRKERTCWRKRIRYAMLAACIGAALFQIQGTAEEGREKDRVPPLEQGAECSLRIQLHYQDRTGQTLPIPGARIHLYQVADLTVEGGSAVYSLTPSFQDSQVVFAGMTTEESIESAKRLERSAQKNQAGLQAGISDEAGQVLFRQLKPGMYLAVQEQTVDVGEDRVRMGASLWSVPLAEYQEEAGKNQWKMDVVTQPKVTETTPAPKPEKPKGKRQPKTGDKADGWIWVGTGSLAAGVWCLRKRMEKRRRLQG
ncbi:hypothetical protein [Suipraeoptans intestinalis]|uniref:hypothetical protein n=1 Tax=Suipraeoptans intestinalis TaxID=2606628 RepID=UPI0023EFAF92|nr:hypothetical protein [Suipraeoptans intestinalis]MDD7769795.1 hypothetical protein [Suipraeoptans intestinalis]MDY3121048.1 hypothetical protein [Suipraeoptans intestinalis]